MMLTGISLPAHAGYDVNKDFSPIGLIASTPIVVMAHPVTIAEWDPTEHAAIRAAPAAIRDKIADAEDWLRDAISELDDLERELREQARSYRGRLNELRRQIDEVLDGEDTGGARQ
jgi:hypothetical protein